MPVASVRGKWSASKGSHRWRGLCCGLDFLNKAQREGLEKGPTTRYGMEEFRHELPLKLGALQDLSPTRLFDTVMMERTARKQREKAAPPHSHGQRPGV